MTGDIHHQQTTITQHVIRLADRAFRAVPLECLQVNALSPTLLEANHDLEVLASGANHLSL